MVLGLLDICGTDNEICSSFNANGQTRHKDPKNVRIRSNEVELMDSTHTSTAVHGESISTFCSSCCFLLTIFVNSRFYWILYELNISVLHAYLLPRIVLNGIGLTGLYLMRYVDMQRLTANVRGSECVSHVFTHMHDFKTS